MTDENEGGDAQIGDLFVPESKADAEPEGKGEEPETPAGEKDQDGDKPEASEGDKPDEKPDETPESVPKAALIDERRKRQDLQKQLDDLKKDIPDEQAPNPADDPEGYKQYLKNQANAELYEDRVNDSRSRMLEKHTDYEEKETYFTAMCIKEPGLKDELKNHPDPAAFAYEKARDALTSNEKSIEDRIMARLEKEGLLKTEDPAKKSAAEVSSLLNSTGAGKNNDTAVKEITQVDELFADR